MPITRQISKPKRLADPAIYNLGHVEDGEKLILWRHHQTVERSGKAYPKMRFFITQTEAAELLGIDPFVYHRLENSNQSIITVEDFLKLKIVLLKHNLIMVDDVSQLKELMENTARVAALVGYIVPTTADQCFLARRRTGTVLREICYALGVSRPKFYDMERRGDAALVAYWEGRGFRFGGKDEVDPGDGGRGQEPEVSGLQRAADRT